MQTPDSTVNYIGWIINVTVIDGTEISTMHVQYLDAKAKVKANLGDNKTISFDSTQVELGTETYDATDTTQTGNWWIATATVSITENNVTTTYTITRHTEKRVGIVEYTAVVAE